MINQFKKTGRVLAFCFGAFLFSATVNKISAQSLNSNPDLTVNYVANKNGQPVYSIQLNNADKQVQTIYIKDVDGTELYSEYVNGGRYSKQFQLNVQNLGTNKIVVTLVDATGKEMNYMVNGRNTKVESGIVTMI
jgi:hypothetical protein